MLPSDLEGKLWALQWVLGAVLRESGVDDERLSQLLDEAREHYPASRDPDNSVGKGFEETASGIRSLARRPDGHGTA